MGPGLGRRGGMRAFLPRAALGAALLFLPTAYADSAKRSVSGFTKVELKLSLDVTIRPGKESSVVLDLRDSDLAGKIVTEVQGDTLVISTNDHSLHMHGKNMATVTMPEFRGVSISGSGDVDVAGFAQSGDVGLAISGSGNISYEGKCSTLTVSISGSGNVKMKGSATSLSASIDGSGDLRGAEFTTKNAAIAVNGSGDADLRIAGGGVQFAVNGSGDIRWTGDASAVSAVTHGSGSIQKH
jgi:hypothetical protein